MADPGDDADQQARVARRRAVPRVGTAGRIAVGIAVLVLAALIGVWVVRKPIAGHVIDRELARRGVAARYTISDLGFGAQRLTNVVIGDPAHPDLVADWIETDTGFGLDGPRLVKLRVGHVRLRGRWRDGRLTLGALDTLMGPPSGRAFALPALRVDIADARMRLETPAGPVGLRLSGRGRIDDGFAGSLAVVAPRLAAAGCTLGNAAAALRVTSADGAPRATGPLSAAAITCQGIAASRVGVDVDAGLTVRFDRWHGRARLAAEAVQASGARIAALSGTLDFAGTAAATAGRVALTAQRMRGAAGGAARLGVEGDYTLGQVQQFAGRLHVQGAHIDRLPLGNVAGTAAGTPLAPLVARAAQALHQAARAFAAEAAVTARLEQGDARIAVTAADVAAASGARLHLTSADGLTYRSRGATVGGAARLTMAGGGLPTLTADIDHPRPDAAVQARIVVDPYAAGDARLALAPVRVTLARGGALRLVTQAQLTGPLAGGRVEALTIPIDLRRGAGGDLVLNPGCTPVSLRGLALAGLRLDPLATRLCSGGGLVRMTRGRVAGGGGLAETHLTGRLGTTPLDLSAGGADLDLATGGFTIHDLAARLGSPMSVTRLDAATLTGRVAAGGVTGTFAGAGGQIGAVPLLLGDAAGDWRFRGGVLTLGGALTARDVAATPRFNPIAGNDVALTLADGVIRAAGTLVEPTTGTRVANVTIDHRLADGSGHADLAVPGIAFTKAFQPDLLTPLTVGVVADVMGTVTGAGHIAWDPAGVTSTGRFATRDMNLAAGVGPVTGITTAITFSDLLALESAPGQVATVKTINPGIAVIDGTIRYQTLPGSRVKVESGEWPFAGGQLTLLPTLLDFAEQQPRRLTFRIRGAAADQFLQQFDFKNLDATGIFDGELPMVFDTIGGRIEGGHLTVRAGGGGLAYVGELTQKDLGFWGNLAFQALRSLRYRSLTITLNGPLAGEMVTEVRFAGVTQGKGAKSNFLIRRLQRLPFVFNVRIKAPFRGLLDTAQSFYDPSRIARSHLTDLLDQQRNTGIQPPASETVP